MDDETRQRIAGAWRLASDHDVAKAATEIDEVDSEIAAIIQAEVIRRNLIGTDPDQIAADTEFVIPKRLAAKAARLAKRHRQVLIAMAIGAIWSVPVRTVGVLFSTAPITISLFPILFSLACYCLLLSAIHFGFPRIRKLGSLAVIVTAVQIGIQVVAIVQWLLPPEYHQSAPWPMGAFLWLILVVVQWMCLFVPLCIAHLIRRKRHPIYPEGCCRTCGYNLTGLPLPRCPECGMSFSPTGDQNSHEVRGPSRADSE